MNQEPNLWISLFLWFQISPESLIKCGLIKCKKQCISPLNCAELTCGWHELKWNVITLNLFLLDWSCTLQTYINTCKTTWESLLIHSLFWVSLWIPGLFNEALSIIKTKYKTISLCYPVLSNLPLKLTRFFSSIKNGSVYKPTICLWTDYSVICTFLTKNFVYIYNLGKKEDACFVIIVVNICSIAETVLTV